MAGVDTGSHPIVDFYRGTHPDAAGRWLRDLRAWDNDELEHTHDYIQWLFPTKNRSQFNPDAPILDEEQIRAFQSEKQLRRELARSFQQMLGFYGFIVREGSSSVVIERSSDWLRRSENWVRPNNHNYLRITRILTSLRLLGFDVYARAFLDVLEDVYRNAPEAIGTRTLEFWRAAGR